MYSSCPACGLRCRQALVLDRLHALPKSSLLKRCWACHHTCTRTVIRRRALYCLPPDGGVNHWMPPCLVTGHALRLRLRHDWRGRSPAACCARRRGLCCLSLVRLLAQSFLLPVVRRLLVVRRLIIFRHAEPHHVACSCTRAHTCWRITAFARRHHAATTTTTSRPPCRPEPRLLQRHY